MTDPNEIPADLTPVRQLELIRSQQRQLDALYGLYGEIEARLAKVEEKKQEEVCV